MSKPMAVVGSRPGLAAPAAERSEQAPAAGPREDARPRPESVLSQRVLVVQQILPLLILAFVMVFEVTTRLLFPSSFHPAAFASELIIYGLAGPAATWVVLHWVAREIAKRERAEGKADTLNAMMQEMHHRIKNNLQTVVDLLTLEMSRNPRPEVQESLRDSIARIKSIAASHEILSADQVGSTDITELARLVSDTARRAMVRLDQHIRIDVKGPSIFLTSKQATAFALVLNELVSNAIEHGFRDRGEGHIQIVLDGDGQDVCMHVQDNGAGLPPEFDLDTSRGLGLQIARTLVEKDLNGQIGLTSASGGLPGAGSTAWVHFGRRHG